MKTTSKKRFLAAALVPLTLSLSIFMGASGGGGGGDGNTPESGEGDGGGGGGEYTGITIATDEDFGDLNIFEATEHSLSADWIYTMIYDRLFELDDEGNFVPSLAVDWKIIPDPNAGPPPAFLMPNITFSSVYWENGVQGWGVFPSGYEDIITEEDFEILNPNAKLIIDIDLQQDVKFNNGTDFNADFLVNFVNYVKVNPDTCVAKIWDNVNTINATDEYTVRMTFDFSQTFSYMDFMYSLTSPMASIVEPYSLSGTGDYKIADEDNGEERTYVTLRPAQDDIFQAQPVECVRFYYVDVESFDETQYDMSVVDGDYYLGHYSGVPHCLVANNPMVLSFNRYRKPCSDMSIREYITNAAFFYRINYDQWFSSVEVSNDFWVRLSNFSRAQSTLVESYDPYFVIEEASPWLDLARGIADVYNSENSKHITVVEADEYLYEDLVTHVDYDIAIREIDLFDINSNYKELYSDLNKFESGVDTQPYKYINQLIELAKLSKNQATYGAMQLLLQNEYINNVLGVNLGWTSKAVINTGELSYYNGLREFSPPSGFGNMSDCSRLDFRHLSKPE